MKKIIALVLALAMILSIATTSASATILGNLGEGKGIISSLLGSAGKIFNTDNKITLPTLNFKDILANVEKSIQGTGLIYGRDYKITVDPDDTFGYRIHLIQPVSGNEILDNYLLYKDGEWTWEKAWALPTLPTLSQFTDFEAIKNNIYTTLWDSGIYVKLDQDVQVTRESQDGYKILILDPFTGRTIYEKHVEVDDVKTFDFNNYFEPFGEDSILAAHFPTTEEAIEEEVQEQQDVIDETPVVVEEQEVAEVLDDVPMAAAPAADAPAAADEIANTGDAAFSAMAAITVLAGAAFVASKKHN